MTVGFVFGALAVFLSYTMGLRQGFALSRGVQPSLEMRAPVRMEQPVVEEPDEDDWARRE
ncbi:MAG: hypothetical protein H5U04_11990 [Firmicutes bacterium]|nr:hypothetical protein [Bacillota bacterium]